jgi:hypothetical protein
MFSVQFEGVGGPPQLNGAGGSSETESTEKLLA